MDPEVVSPELAGEKDVAVVKVGRRQILLEVVCNHVHCVDVGDFTTNDARFSRPALDCGLLVPKFVRVASVRLPVMLGLLLPKAAQVVSRCGFDSNDQGVTPSTSIALREAKTKVELLGKYCAIQA